MIFIVIVILSLIASYLIVTSGLLKYLKGAEDDNSIIDTIMGHDTIEPGMLGSPPSDLINVFDSKKVIEMPLSTNIDALIDSFQMHGNNVFKDFNSNHNSKDYKKFLFDDYKLEFLRRNEALSSKQLGDYYRVRNTIGADIENKFNYFLDLIKLNKSLSYYTFRKLIVNETGTDLTFTYNDISQIVGYIMQATDKPGEIILLLKYKLDLDSQDLLEQVIMFAGYNYYKTLEILDVVLMKEPEQGITIADKINNSSVDSKGVPRQGFWSQVYHAFKSNNIDSYLINMIKLSFMTETLYKAVLATIISSIQNIKIAEAINNLVKHCKHSQFKMIHLFPYQFTLALLTDGIRENYEMLAKHGIINVLQIDRDLNKGTAVQNIQYYRNIEINFPVSIKILPLQSNSEITTVDMGRRDYATLSEDYMIENYLSFPNFGLNGIYFDRTGAIAPTVSGFIIISNINSLNPITISGLAIYAALQLDLMITDVQNVQDTFLDNNIVFGGDIVVIEHGSFATGVWKPLNGNITDIWRKGGDIIIEPGNSVRIVPLKKILRSSTPSIYESGLRFLRIYGLMLPITTRTSTDFLQITVVNDALTTRTYNQFNIKNIPSNVNNLLIGFDSVYPLTDYRTNAPSNTYAIIDSLIDTSDKLTIVNIGPNPITTNGMLDLSTSITADATKSTLGLISPMVMTQLDSPITNSSNGLINDTTHIPRVYNDINDRKIYRIRINNNGLNPLAINKMVIFGHTYAGTSLANDASLFNNDYLGDNSVLPADSVIKVYSMSTPNKIINYTDTLPENPLIDTYNRSTPQQYILSSNKSIYIQPLVSPAEDGSQIKTDVTKYVNMRAIYIELGSIPDINQFQFEILNLTDTTKTRVYTKSDQVWTNNKFLIILNYPQSSASTTILTDQFSILPLYARDNFSTIPTYIYDQYYDPIAELSQQPYHWDKK